MGKEKKVFRGYISSRSFMEERAPQHVQNIIIRDYCNKKNIHYLLSATEYAMVNSNLILKQLINDLPLLTALWLIVFFKCQKMIPKDKIFLVKYFP